jgi:predicted acetylornithine/succinylornithine family transaminase
VEFEKGNGFNLYGVDGKKYVDFLSGIAVTGFGHNHPVIKAAVMEQIEKLWHTSNLFQSSGQEALAKKLAERAGLDNVFFCNSGTEANEAAIKYARKWGKERTTIISALGGFHGRTMGSLAASGQYKLWEGFYPLTPGFRYVPFGDFEAVEYSYDPGVCAIMLEPIQGESGIITPPAGYLKKVSEFCNKHNILLIMDEVQSGMGRTGKFFAHQWEDIQPDIITIAKGIANGIPLGAVIASAKAGSEMKPGSHGSTFGGNPVAVAAANAVLDLIDDNLLDSNFKLGEKLKNSIELLYSDKIKAVRGRGLLIGVEFIPGIKAKEIAKNLLDCGYVVGVSGDSVIRLLPPFIITENELVNFVLKLKEIIE